MAVSKVEFYDLLKTLFNDNQTVAKMAFDYVDQPFGYGSTIDLYLAVKEIHGEHFANIFVGYLEQAKNPRLRSDN